MQYRAKDFIETRQGLLFAVVSDGLEQGKALCFLRYLKQDGVWRKLGSDEANAYLADKHPHYRHYSERLDAHMHAVAESDMVEHYRPQSALQALLQRETQDPVIRDLQALCGLFEANGLDLAHFGVTGSLLVGMQNHTSDIDLVCYQRESFHQARLIVQALIAKDQCQALNEDDWLTTYQRRACDFALDDYIWHEQRKYNKAMFNRRKFDLSLLTPEAETERQFRKLGRVEVQLEVDDDTLAFDYPAQFSVRHPSIGSVVCFTATYTGQAQAGERIVVAGQLEQDNLGGQRIVVGSNREAVGEFIKVVR